MKTKVEKPAPDGTIYLTPDGTRVMLVERKQSPYRDTSGKIAVRVSDGHRLGTFHIDKLRPE